MGAIVVLVLIVASLAWYFVSDRLTPYTSQARVQAFVVPVAAEVPGQVLKVHVKNNDEVQAGQPLFEIDPTPYRIALQRSRSDYESVRRSINASGLSVDGGEGRAAGGRRHSMSTPARTRRASSRSTPKTRGRSRFAASRTAQAALVAAHSQEKAAEADLRARARAPASAARTNAQLISARSAVEKAELDLKRTEVVAPARRRRDATCAPMSASTHNPARRR